MHVAKMFTMAGELYFSILTGVLLSGVLTQCVFNKLEMRRLDLTPSHSSTVTGYWGCETLCYYMNSDCEAANVVQLSANNYLCEIFTSLPGAVQAARLLTSSDSRLISRNAIVWDYSDECGSSPCLNGGTCQDQGTEYSCLCTPEYAGDHCQIDNLCVSTTPCLNGATCLFDDVTITYSCTCVPGYTGATCDTYGHIYSLQGAVVTITDPLTVDVYLESGDMGGDWIVIMRRKDGSVDFVNKLWADYRDGFGGVSSSEFWLGNEAVHQLTNNGSTWTLRIELETFTGECRYADYSSFSLGPESDFYRLHLSGYSGTAGDALTAVSPAYGNHNGRRFQATDNKDNGNVDNWKGAWWYTGGYYGKLTGHYGSGQSWYGIIWEVWMGGTPLAYADMKIHAD